MLSRSKKPSNIKVNINDKIDKDDTTSLLEKSRDSIEKKMSTMRMEGPWNTQIEEFMNDWKAMCVLKSNLHSKAGYIFKKKNTYWGLPSVLIPISMAPISVMMGYNDCDSSSLTWQTIFNSSAFLLSGLFSGVYSFFKFGEKMEQFFNFSSRYYDVVTEIEAELIKERKFRLPADVFIIRIKMLVDNLSKNEPVLPQKLNK